MTIDGKVTMKVPAELELIKKVGSGAYGTVASFKDRAGKKVAVKKITDAFHDLIDGKRILREIRLLRFMNHDNILRIVDLYPPDHPDFDDIYIVTDVMETDLHRVIYSKQVLAEEHHQYFAYQILRGLLYMHSANVVHRDLKPSNILVNKDCDLKICDFGLARGLGLENDEDSQLTDYVVTRWYRAPEVVLLASEYTKSIDVWSVGCILCELIGRKPIFTGKDHLDQIKKVLSYTGTPPESDLAWLPARSPARSFLRKMPAFEKKNWKTVYPSASDNAVTAIETMLTFDPTKRADVKQCISLPYFSQLHMEDDEPVAPAPVDWAFDKFTPTKRLLQNYIYAESSKFHPEILRRDAKLLGERGITKDKIPELP